MTTKAIRQETEHTKAICSSEVRYEIAKHLALANASLALAHIYLERFDEIRREVRP